MSPDFIPVAELARLTGFKLRSLYHQHSTQHGPLVPILAKLGRKLGCWRPDYDTSCAQQRKLPDSTT